MPKIFSEEQREEMRKRLLDAGRRVFSEYGIRKTRVEDITKLVGIAKGTFYSFFPSKEALYFAVLDELEKSSRPLLNDILNDKTLNHRERLRKTLKIQLQSIEQFPVVKTLFNPEEIAYLVRNVSPGEVSGHINEHNEFYKNFLRELSENKRLSVKDIETAGALLQTIFFLVIHKDEIGPAFEKQMNLLIDLIVDGLIIEKKQTK